LKNLTVDIQQLLTTQRSFTESAAHPYQATPLKSMAEFNLPPNPGFAVIVPPLICFNNSIAPSENISAPTHHSITLKCEVLDHE
jgi:hypothetical protein